MKPFLEEIADYILTHHGHETGDICLVTPNRRAGLFFRKHLSSRVDRVIWAPEAISIEDFINRISGLSVPDTTSLLFHFYEVYLRLEQEAAKPVEEFFRWAPVLLADMDEIDAHHDSPSDIYSALRDIKRIETWNPDGSPLTEFQRTYLAFFDKLELWHAELTAHLLARQLGSQGLSSRVAARKLAASTYEMPWKKIILVGFNALNQCEEVIIKSLLRQQKAVFLTDGDPYYVDDPGHEAGLFIRQTIKKLGIPAPAFEAHFSATKKEIRLLGIARNVNQARLAGNILLQRPEISRDEQTAIVLANEKLLIPMLNALPEGVDKVNVTMGYPLTRTHLHGFFDAWWRLYLLRAGTGHAGSDKVVYYHKDLTRFFGHGLAGMLWDKDDGSGMAASLVQQVRRSNRSFFTMEELSGLISDHDTFHAAFGFLKEDPVADTSLILQSMLDVVIRLDTRFREKAGEQGSDIVNTPYFVDFEALYFLSGLLRRLQGLLRNHPFLNSFKTIYSLYRQLSESTRLSFAGEPLEGLQVMGMLETRNLDFKNIILLSANENIIPRPKNNSSFIPYDVRRRFGLQVHTDKDAIFAYHFYRLLQRAENVYLVYNTQSEDIGSSEKSRFLTQLQMELRQYAPHITISEQIVALPVPTRRSAHEPVVEKTPAIMERLMQISRSGLSPSAMNTYISCTLQFYFSRVAGIRETEEVEETIEAATMGTVVHGVLESLFSSFIGKVPQAGDYDAMLQQTASLARKQFEEHYQGGDLSTGKNLLLFNLARRYVDNFLREERRRLAEGGEGARILALEQGLDASLEVDTAAGKTVVRVRGMADRIDEAGGSIRIIDYKTGKLRPNELKLDSWEHAGSDHSKAFQLLTYAWMYHQMNPGMHAVMPGIVSLRETRKGLQTLQHPEGTGPLAPEHNERFEVILKEKIQEILNPDIPFTRTPDEDNCLYCPFKVFCQRV